MPFEPIVPEGQHLGTSRTVDGASTGHLFDDETNELRGHAAWIWVDEPVEYLADSGSPEPPRELTQEERDVLVQLAGLIVIGILAGVDVASPHVRKWWKERFTPAISSFWRRMTSRLLGGSSGPEGAPPGSGRAAIESAPTGAELLIVESTIMMSRAEWEHRFRAMLLARSFAEQQERIISGARIVDDGRSVSAQGPTELLSAQQFSLIVERMLEQQPGLLTEETLAEVLRVLGGRPELA